MNTDTSPRLVRFGPFDLDRYTLELRKHGLKIKVSGQPMEVLAMLLAGPGELVTRDELQKRLWPDNTIVDFDHSINAAIKTLRRALGDSADKPQYIETLARRGYRFLYPVQQYAPSASSERNMGEDSAFGAAGDRTTASPVQLSDLGPTLEDPPWREIARCVISMRQKCTLNCA
jgi:DNA-binding winged helix-turn-helix (wHTH) protein